MIKPNRKLVPAALRTEWSALAWLGDRQNPPMVMDEAKLPGMGVIKVGQFWRDCKCVRRCVRAPYDRLLTNPVLRADYRTHHGGTRAFWRGRVPGGGRARLPSRTWFARVGLAPRTWAGLGAARLGGASVRAAPRRIICTRPGSGRAQRPAGLAGAQCPHNTAAVWPLRKRRSSATHRGAHLCAPEGRCREQQWHCRYRSGGRVDRSQLSCNVTV